MGRPYLLSHAEQPGTRTRRASNTGSDQSDFPGFHCLSAIIVYNKDSRSVPCEFCHFIGDAEGLFRPSASQLAQEFVFVHAVLEGFPAIDEDDWNFVGELTAKLVVAVHVNFLPSEAAAAMEFVQALLDDLAEMTSLARIEDDLPGLRHGASVTENHSEKLGLHLKVHFLHESGITRVMLKVDEQGFYAGPLPHRRKIGACGQLVFLGPACGSPWGRHSFPSPYAKS